MRTCQRLANQKQALWTFLEHPGIEPTNNAAERALRPAVIQRKISHGVQPANGALCQSRLLTVTTTLRQQGRDVWGFLELSSDIRFRSSGDTKTESSPEQHS